ncbi:MAG: hypothetical protein P8X39_01285 [Desulfofustis sp.]|jgi:4-deoxy-L-threo-5-hexosulose-uronate ketol-isomerase
MQIRHLIVGKEQILIAPNWSNHPGIGTASSLIIRDMDGENQDFDEMDHIPLEALR